MAETLLWVVLGWAIGSFLLALLRATHDDGEDEVSVSPNQFTGTTIYMEEVKGWWYGWSKEEGGPEVFIGQGTSYDEALNNCKQRIQEQHPDLKLKYTFEMKNASTTVQN